MKIVLIVIGVILLLGLIGFIAGSIGLGDVKKMVINDVDLSRVPDGVYRGKFHKVRWTYDVEVTVKDHKITAIKTLNKVDGREMIVEGAQEAIIKNQSVKIDAVSGASIDTKAFQKAVENALAEGAK